MMEQGRIGSFNQDAATSVLLAALIIVCQVVNSGPLLHQE